ncbi:MAG: hypothetical protein LKJ90_02075 [Faecalibacterium sp.]|nr:hypothetical protein [Faecalibacterium sp.]
MIAESLVTFAIGAAGYGGIELLWRGHTHWTMLLAGGVCLTGLRLLSRSPLPFLTQCVLGSSLITGVELSIGLVCNCALHWNIWNYAGQWCNLMGQVCPLYSMLWFFLCIPVLGILRYVNGSVRQAPAAVLPSQAFSAAGAPRRPAP